MSFKSGKESSSRVAVRRVTNEDDLLLSDLICFRAADKFVPDPEFKLEIAQGNEVSAVIRGSQKILVFDPGNVDLTDLRILVFEAVASGLDMLRIGHTICGLYVSDKPVYKDDALCSFILRLVLNHPFFFTNDGNNHRWYQCPITLDGYVSDSRDSQLHPFYCDSSLVASTTFSCFKFAKLQQLYKSTFYQFDISLVTGLSQTLEVFVSKISSLLNCSLEFHALSTAWFVAVSHRGALPPELVEVKAIYANAGGLFLHASAYHSEVITAASGGGVTLTSAISDCAQARQSRDSLAIAFLGSPLWEHFRIFGHIDNCSNGVAATVAKSVAYVIFLSGGIDAIMVFANYLSLYRMDGWVRENGVIVWK